MDESIVFSFAKGQLLVAESNPAVLSLAPVRFSDVKMGTGLLILPLETLTQEDWQKLLSLSEEIQNNIVLQTFLNSVDQLVKNLKAMAFNRYPIQVWFNDTLPSDLIERASELEPWSLTWVYSPYMLVRPNEIHFERLPSDRLYIHFSKKKSEYDAWPNITHFWHLLTCVMRHHVLNGQIKELRCIVEKSCLDLLPWEYREFLYKPSHDNYLKYLKHNKQESYKIQSSWDKMVRVLKPSISEFVLWPIKKPYWFLQYQFKKLNRIHFRLFKSGHADLSE